jgi:hypothetical protein
MDVCTSRAHSTGTGRTGKAVLLTAVCLRAPKLPLTPSGTWNTATTVCVRKLLSITVGTSVAAVPTLAVSMVLTSGQDWTLPSSPRMPTALVMLVNNTCGVVSVAGAAAWGAVQAIVAVTLYVPGLSHKTNCLPGATSGDGGGYAAFSGLRAVAANGNPTELMTKVRHVPSCSPSCSRSCSGA